MLKPDCFCLNLQKKLIQMQNAKHNTHTTNVPIDNEVKITNPVNTSRSSESIS